MGAARAGGPWGDRDPLGGDAGVQRCGLQGYPAQASEMQAGWEAQRLGAGVQVGQEAQRWGAEDPLTAPPVHAVLGAPHPSPEQEIHWNSPSPSMSANFLLLDWPRCLLVFSESSLDAIAFAAPPPPTQFGF